MILDFSCADPFDELVECVDGFFLRFGLGWGVGADHSSGFANGVDDIAVAGVGIVDNLLEAIEKLLAGESCVLPGVLLEGLEILLRVFSLEDATGIGGGASDGAVVASFEPGLAHVAGDVVAVQEVFLARG